MSVPSSRLPSSSGHFDRAAALSRLRENEAIAGLLTDGEALRLFDWFEERLLVIGSDEEADGLISVVRTLLLRRGEGTPILPLLATLAPENDGDHADRTLGEGEETP